MDTPNARWINNNEVDPHEGKYDCQRKDLTLGELTDDELANEVFMWGDHRPSPKEIMSGNAKMSHVYLTAGKERIRWLSRQNTALNELNADLISLVAALCVSSESDCIRASIAGVLPLDEKDSTRWKEQVKCALSCLDKL